MSRRACLTAPPVRVPIPDPFLQHIAALFALLPQTTYKSARTEKVTLITQSMLRDCWYAKSAANGAKSSGGVQRQSLRVVLISAVENNCLAITALWNQSISGPTA